MTSNLLYVCTMCNIVNAKFKEHKHFVNEVETQLR
jgi:hypothetical protein